MATLFLMGFMGSGKSAVARAVALRLRLDLIDLDTLIEKEIGCSIAQFWAREGEAAFRAIESRLLQDVCQQHAVVSLGGGVPTQETNRKILQQAARDGAVVAYLQTSPDVLAQRIRRAPGKRPLIDGEGQLSLEETKIRVEELLKEREEFYRSCANTVINTDSLTVPGVARQLAGSYLDACRNCQPHSTS